MNPVINIIIILFLLISVVFIGGCVTDSSSMSSKPDNTSNVSIEGEVVFDNESTADFGQGNG